MQFSGGLGGISTFHYRSTTLAVVLLYIGFLTRPVEKSVINLGIERLVFPVACACIELATVIAIKHRNFPIKYPGNNHVNLPTIKTMVGFLMLRIALVM